MFSSQCPRACHVINLFLFSSLTKLLKVPNINGTTIHTALSIPKESGDFAPPMSDQKRTQLRLTLSELKIIIVDEISMVANTTLLHIHQRLKEIFDTPNSELFARISFIAVGDLYQ